MITPPDVTTLYKSLEGYHKAMQNYDDLLRQIEYPFETRFIETPQAVTHVVCMGDEAAPPVFLWHGLDASAPTWVEQINALAPHYRLIVPDVPGSMGKSAPERFDRKGLAYGAWMTHVMDALQIERAAHIGISNGGWLILKLAAAVPHKIVGAILISSAGFVSPSPRLVLKIMPVLLLSPFISKKARARHFATMMGSPYYPVADQDLSMFEVMLGDFHYEQGPGALPDDTLRCLTAPTYLLMGEYEAAFTPPKVLSRAKAVLPNLKHAEIIPRVAHGMINEDIAGVNQRLLRFLAEIYG